MPPLPRRIIGGIVGGALVGLLIGAYVGLLTEDHVIRRADFAQPQPYEQSKSRFLSTVLVAFALVFAAVGPVIASASFGRWIRHAVFGMVAAIGSVVVITLVTATITNQQPFNMMKGSPSTCIDIARNYAVPAAVIVGPIAGIWVGRRGVHRQ